MAPDFFPRKKARIVDEGLLNFVDAGLKKSKTQWEFLDKQIPL